MVVTALLIKYSIVQSEVSILSTGALDQQVKEAVDEHIMIETIPFIATKPVDAPSLQGTLKQKEFIVVTSSNAVEALAGIVTNTSVSWTFFCIGHATRKMVAKYFGSSSIAAVGDNATELAKEIVKARISEKVLFLCGNQRRDELPDQLRASGIEVHEVIVYETTLTPKKIEKNYDGILFFSPSAVHSFFSMNQVQPPTVLFVIGSTTAAALKEYTGNKIILANKPEREEVLKKVIEYFKK